MHGNNTRNLPVYLSSSQTSKNTVFLFILYVFSSTKLETKIAEQVQSGGGSGSVGGGGPNNVCKCK
jgi:hypothetical protein